MKALLSTLTIVLLGVLLCYVAVIIAWKLLPVLILLALVLVGVMAISVYYKN